MHVKFCGLIFRAFDWKENLQGINFHGYGRYNHYWIC